jgi:CBS domain-containing protein
MGFFGTITTFGIGYAAGAVTGKRSMERLPDRVRQVLPGERGGSNGVTTTGDGVTSPDLREIRQVMTSAPDAVRPSDTLQEAARLMRSNDIGDVLVEDDHGGLAGIITDRDIAIRATAEGLDPSTTIVDEVYTRDIAALAPRDTVDDAMRSMRAANVRRLPVVESGKAIGIVSLGDISVETTPESLLADISAASPDR